MTSKPDTARRAGIGLRLPHLAEVVATRPSAGWFEIHPENFLANPHATELLIELSRTYPLSIHTVGISVGSASGIDAVHLARVRALIDRVNPILVSGHLAWSTHGAEYLNDLLPLPYDEESLTLVSAHLRQVQDALGRPFLLENPSTYVGFAGSTMTEVDFLRALVDRTGCRLLCDVSNVCLSGHNMGYDPRGYIDALPPEAIAELHLGGWTAEDDEPVPGAELLVDTHAAPVAESAWALYAHAVQRFGSLPTLVEWDNDIPPLATLLGEAVRADAIAAEATAPEASRALAR